MIEGPLLITGAGGGIGRATAVLAAERGAALALLDLDREGLERTTDAVRSHGREVSSHPCDVADADQVAAAVAAATKRLGAPRALVTAAGIDRGGGPLEALEPKVWEQVLAVNLGGTFLACRAVLPGMVAARAGAIVCISSPLALVSAALGSSAYSASKAGVSALVREIAVGHGRDGVRANALLPGPTETELMWAGAAEAEVPELRRRVSAEVPIGRVADPVEIARAAAWLLSGESSYVNGAQLACDGGVLAKASVSI